MRALGRIFRFLFWGILVGGVVWLLRVWLRSVVRRGVKGTAAPPSPTSIPLHRDPVCGTFVSPEVSVRLEQAGQVEHFCSAECRDRYLRSHQRTASA